MNKKVSDSVIGAALKGLDPAAQDNLSEAEKERADAAFTRIVATSQVGEPHVNPVRTRRKRRGLFATAGVTGAAGIALSVFLLGGGAYASWTPTPEPLSAAAANKAAENCIAAFTSQDEELQGVLAEKGASQQLVLAEKGASQQLVMAEKRGEWTYVLLEGEDRQTICLMPDGFEAKGDRRGFFGSSGELPEAPTLGADGFDESTSAQGSTSEGYFVWVEGYVGSDVTGVTVHTSSGADIEASVVDSRFAAWWPAVAQSSKKDAETWTYSVHLADGTSRSIK